MILNDFVDIQTDSSSNEGNSQILQSIQYFMESDITTFTEFYTYLSDTMLSEAGKLPTSPSTTNFTNFYQTWEKGIFMFISEHQQQSLKGQFIHELEKIIYHSKDLKFIQDQSQLENYWKDLWSAYQKISSTLKKEKMMVGPREFPIYHFVGHYSVAAKRNGFSLRQDLEQAILQLKQLAKSNQKSQQQFKKEVVCSNIIELNLDLSSTKFKNVSSLVIYTFSTLTQRLNNHRYKSVNGSMIKVMFSHAIENQLKKQKQVKNEEKLLDYQSKYFIMEKVKNAIKDCQQLLKSEKTADRMIRKLFATVFDSIWKNTQIYQAHIIIQQIDKQFKKMYESSSESSD